MMTHNRDQNHILHQAKWIWPQGQLYLNNSYASFRKDFYLKERLAQAILYLTADQHYKLYVNGVYLCRGPARGYQEHWPYDQIDIAPYLKIGKNWISVLAYNPGISTFTYIHKSSAGFLCAVKLGDECIISDESWYQKRITAIISNTARYSIQLNFQEHVNLTTINHDWIYQEDFDDTNPLEEDYYEWNVSAHALRTPYEALEARDIPLLKEAMISFQTLTFQDHGTCHPSYKETNNASWLWAKEARITEHWQRLDQPLSLDAEGYALLNFEPTDSDKYIAYTIDLGEYITGTLEVLVPIGQSNSIIDFQFHEHVLKTRPAIRPSGGKVGAHWMCNIALANRLYLGNKKALPYAFYHTQGFRYVTVILRNSQQPLTLGIRARTIGYPFKMQGSFHCSDEELNDIFSICKRTQQICSLDAYVDTPWREQAQWWGDARVQAKNTFYLDGDIRLLKRGIQSISEQRTQQGLTFGHAPTIAYNCILPDFSLTWIITIWDYYWQTGDIALFKKYWGGIQQIINYFDSSNARSKLGLIQYDERYWYFGDWADLYRENTPTYLNLFYLYTLQYLLKLLHLSHMSIEVKDIQAKYDQLLGLVKNYLYDKELNIMVGGLDQNQQKVYQISIHDQLLALMLNEDLLEK